MKMILKRGFIMSVYYDVKEYLRVQEITDRNQALMEMVRQHLAWLGWKMLTDDARVEISLSYGKKHFTFSGETVTADFHEIIRFLEDLPEMDDGYALELSLNYHYRWTGLDPKNACDHLVISNYLEQAYETELENVFYTMYNNADCGDGAGTLCAYGEKNGHIYKGTVQDKPISDFPDSGNWYAPREAIVCCIDSFEGMDMDAIRNVVNQLMCLSSHDNFTDSETEFDYFMNNFNPKNVEDFHTFIRLAGELIKLTKNTYGFLAELVDLDDPHGRILKIDIDDPENYTVTMACV